MNDRKMRWLTISIIWLVSITYVIVLVFYLPPKTYPSTLLLCLTPLVIFVYGFAWYANRIDRKRGEQ